MGRTIYDEVAESRALFEQANEILGYDLAELCFNGPAEKLNSTVHSQPALYVTNLAALEVLKKNQPEAVEGCTAAAGLSLGEYCAMVLAGVMDFETGLRIVKRRGEAMQEASDLKPSGMVSILGLTAEVIGALIQDAREEGEVLEIANYLCPGNIVVSGSEAACQRVAALADAAGAMKTIPLTVAGAFHTELMRPAVDQLAEALADVPLSSPRIPVVSNVDAQPHSDPEEIRSLLVDQVVSPVRWEDSVRYLLSQEHSTFYEVGPGSVLRGLLKRIDRKAKRLSATE